LRASSAAPARRLLSRIGTAWVGVELFFATLAISVFVAVGPVIAVLGAQPADPVLAVIAVLSVSLPAAAWLGGSVLKLSRELIAQGARR
jgi:hypothetical protein